MTTDFGLYRRFMLVALPFLLITACFAQGSRDEEDFRLMMFSFDYASNSASFGRSITGYKQPTYTASFNYFSKNGMEIGAAPSFLSVKDSTGTTHSGELDILLGYQWDISKEWSLYGGYTHMFYTDKSNVLQTAVSNILEADLDYSNKFYSAGLTINYLFGKKGTLYFSYRNALNFNFDKIFFKNDNLFLSVEADIDFSDKNYYNDFIYDNYSGIELAKWVNNNYPLMTDWVISRILINGLEATKTAVKTIIDNHDSSVFGRKYTFTSVNILLPVMYSIDNFTISFGIFAVIPFYESDFFTPEKQLFYTAGITYLLPL